MSNINSATVALIRELKEFMVCDGSINKGIKGVYGCVTVVCLRHILVRRIWTAWIFLYPLEAPYSIGRLSFLGWTAFGMSSSMSVLVMTLFSLHGGYVVPFTILGTLKRYGLPFGSSTYVCN
jgi:hypothetical protein